MGGQVPNILHFETLDVFSIDLSEDCRNLQLVTQVALELT